MSNKKDQIIQAAAELFEEQGYHATGLSQILERSQAPKGSLYYYFPDGKQQLAVETIQYTASTLAGRIRAGLDQAENLKEAISGLVLTIAEQIERSGYRSGGPLTALAMETATSDPEINQACREAFEQIRQPIEDTLRGSGIEESRVRGLGTLIISAIEGGTLLSRTQHSGDPLREVTPHLISIIKE
jgi:TetR/AcrR family transcriptional repressor of lmrAB and yxaGH operons